MYKAQNELMLGSNFAAWLRQAALLLLTAVASASASSVTRRSSVEQEAVTGSPTDFILING